MSGPGEIFPESDELVRPITKKDLQEIATTLTGGTTWYGLSISDPESHLAGFASCFVNGLLRWTLHDGVYEGISDAHKNEPLILVDNLRSLSTEGDRTQFLNAAVAACRERSCFRTGSGIRGLGPVDMKLGDCVYVLYRASMPFFVRPKGSAFRLIGECYVHGLMHGPGIPNGLTDKV